MYHKTLTVSFFCDIVLKTHLNIQYLSDKINITNLISFNCIKKFRKNISVRCILSVLSNNFKIFRVYSYINIHKSILSH